LKIMTRRLRANLLVVLARLAGGVALICLPLVTVPLSAGPVRIAIPAEVLVQTDAIVLRDLLPLSAPTVVRDLAANISLGAAPQMGTARAILRESLLAMLDSASLAPSRFTVPEVVTVRRASRPLSREEVIAAIQDALGKNAL